MFEGFFGGDKKESEKSSSKKLTPEEIKDLRIQASGDDEEAEKASEVLRNAQKKSVKTRKRNKENKEDLQKLQEEVDAETDTSLGLDDTPNIMSVEGDIMSSADVSPEDREAYMLKLNQAANRIKDIEIPQESVEEEPSATSQDRATADKAFAKTREILKNKGHEEQS